MTQINYNKNLDAGKKLTYEECIKIEGYKELEYSNSGLKKDILIKLMKDSDLMLFVFKKVNNKIFKFKK